VSRHIKPQRGANVGRIARNFGVQTAGRSDLFGMGRLFFQMGMEEEISIRHKEHQTRLIQVSVAKQVEFILIVKSDPDNNQTLLVIPLKFELHLAIRLKIPVIFLEGLSKPV